MTRLRTPGPGHPLSQLVLTEPTKLVLRRALDMAQQRTPQLPAAETHQEGPDPFLGYGMWPRHLWAMGYAVDLRWEDQIGETFFLSEGRLKRLFLLQKVSLSPYWKWLPRNPADSPAPVPGKKRSDQEEGRRPGPLQPKKRSPHT